MQLPEAETAFNWKIVQSRSFSSLCLTQLSPSLSREPVWKATSPYSIDINSTQIELYFCLLENIEPKTIATDVTTRGTSRNHLFNQTLCFTNCDKPQPPKSPLSGKQTWNKRIRNSLWHIDFHLRLIYYCN